MLECMSTLQVRDLDEQTHRTLKARAAKEGLSLSDYVARELERVAQTPTMDEFLERVKQREPVELPESAADMLRKLRGE